MRINARLLVVVFVAGLLLGGDLPLFRVTRVTAVARQGIRHKKVSVLADGSDPTQIQPSNWNDEHSFDVLGFGAMSAPVATIDGDCWMEAAGTSPSRTLAWKCRDSGVTRTVASITF